MLNTGEPKQSLWKTFFIPSNAEEELCIISARKTCGTNLRVTAREWREDSLIGRIASASHNLG